MGKITLRLWRTKLPWMLGVSGFISKPFELNCLESKIALKTQEANCLMNNLS